MDLATIEAELKALGSASYRKILGNHGAREPLYGVKIADLKKLQKKIGMDHALAQELFATGNYDAQYLAGMIVDDSRMTAADLRRWLKESNCPVISGTVIAWTAAEGKHGEELALKWIDSKQEEVAHAGWSTLASVVSIRDDADLDVEQFEGLLDRVERTIHKEPNLVRSAMNAFLIAAGTYVRDLTTRAMQAGKRIGPVSVDVGETSCKVPFAPEVLEKLIGQGAVGKKRKTARC